MLNCLMTWEPVKARWKKIYKGKSYTIFCTTLGVPQNKVASYLAANEWWIAKKAEIDSQTPVKPHPMAPIVQELERRLEWAEKHGERETAASLAKKIIWANDESEEPDSMSEIAYLGMPESQMLWHDRLSRNKTPITADRKIKSQVDRHIALERSRVDAGQLSVSEFDTIRRCLQDFQDWVGGSNPVESLDSEKWESWWSHLMKMDISIEYKKKKLRYVRSFISWLAEKGMVAVPPNLHSRRYRFGGGAKSVPTIPIDDVKYLIRESPGQLRLHLLLMLNCGMTQTDISDLKPSEVDWEKGRIKRKRSKTEDHANVPTVEYPLWPETLALLLKFGKREGDRALLTESGRTWVRDSIKKDGKRSKVDAIKSNYVHLQRRLGMVHSMKLLRKTSASLLETSPEFARYSTMFLGHSPRSIADRHYVVPSQEQFDRAIGWLGGKLQQ